MPSIETEAVGSFWRTDCGRVELWLGDVRKQLRLMPERSAQCCVTSPPYWGLRDYSRCFCATQLSGRDDPASSLAGGGNVGEKKPNPSCEICGGTGRTFDGNAQIGAEPSPDCGTQGRGQCGRCFVCSMVAVFREVKRVLRDDGVLWLNLGDSYARTTPGRNDVDRMYGDNAQGRGLEKGRGILPSGNLAGIPWRVALALQADGWVLRQDVIWSKVSPMPESVRNRCTKSHEHVFVFAKAPGYYWDAEAIREESKGEWNSGRSFGVPSRKSELIPAEDKDWYRTRFADSTFHSFENQVGANKRDVWNVDDERALFDWMAANCPDELEEFMRQSGNKTDVWRLSSGGGYAGAHFATFPEKLITPMILATTSEKGCCANCGAPWRRVTEVHRRPRKGGGGSNFGRKHPPDGWEDGMTGQHQRGYREALTTTTDWEPTCECHGKFRNRWISIEVRRRIHPSAERDGKDDSRDHSLARNRHGIGTTNPQFVKEEQVTASTERVMIREYVPSISLNDHPLAPCTVLDPFVGSGTTALACLALGRRAVGIDLSKAYLRDHAIQRVKVWLANSAPMRAPGG
jgi:DNA modification methylase